MILTEGRVRVGSRYPVMYGNSTGSPETAEVIDTGDYLQMKNKETENSTTAEVTSPTSSSPHSPQSPVTSPNLQTVGDHQCKANRDGAHFTFTTTENLLSGGHAKTANISFDSTTYSNYAENPTFHQRQLPDFDTPTRGDRPDTPVTPSIPPVTPSILPTTPTAHTTIRSVPMHLFADIPDGVRLTENDLNQAASSSTTPGAFAVSLLKYLFHELLITDNLRVYFSYRGGGKLNKRPLDDTRKQYLRRYVTAFCSSVILESAYNAMVIEKIDQFLRRPIQQKY
ncbi:unnamed protein product [Mytilus coruscus]|uniref:BEN domain-containing protein n=1 Tax=Mytilus coruscus TaxID=42192 RepID=A0A6J8ATF0_MYTCO|nr:unnamed protein product [Mytilus coruscus]